MKRIIRVFPRRTRATPVDKLVRIGQFTGLFDDCDEVNISVTFEWDLRFAEQLEKGWSRIVATKIGGPATGEPSGDFIPGMYLKTGYTITSRGCPNRCWFCSVWRREGPIRELPIKDGWNILDDNLLACSENHIRNVFKMLARQKERPEFTGGLEAARLKPWHVIELKKLKPKQVFFAYDTKDDLEPLIEAGRLMITAGFTTASHSMRCYVLCGYPGDTLNEADRRMREAIDAGFTPMAMLWRNKKGEKNKDWARFQRTWARPAIIYGA